jgi:hypothetical protein
LALAANWGVAGFRVSELTQLMSRAPDPKMNVEHINTRMKIAFLFIVFPSCT